MLQQLRSNGLNPVLMNDPYDPEVVTGKTDNLTRVWVEKGNYYANKNLDVSKRFVAGGTQPDVVRMRQARSGNLYFGQSLIDRPVLGAIGRAASRAEAAFFIGSRLASINMDQSALNGLLGGLLGTTLNLSLADYNALIATDGGLLGFLDKFAPRVGLAAGTYQELLDTDVSVGMLASVLAEVSTANPKAKAALDVLGKNAAALSAEVAGGTVAWSGIARQCFDRVRCRI